MPRVPAAYLEARRRGILKAAQRCFVRGGLHATTTREICRAANLSPGAVYRYFDSKQAIIEELARESRERMSSFVSSLDLEDGGHPVEALLGALDRPEAAEWIRLDAALWAEAVRTEETGRLFRDAAHEVAAELARRVRLEQDRGRLDPALDAAAFGRLLLALFDGLALQKAIDSEIDSRGVARALIDRLG
ncbi:MAG: TetR/AcrR family transcriptional regulator [Thermoanaerobaculia bacterium]|nr:TetR/AcrR family transcriptional regulator [Thermoanaerobaculia bacterium]